MTTLPFIPPVDDLVKKLSIANEQLKHCPLADIIDTSVIHRETGSHVYAYTALKSIALQINAISDAAFDYAKAHSHENNGDAA